VKHLKLYEEFIAEQVSPEALYIHNIVGSGQNATQDFIDEFSIDGKKLADYVKAQKGTKEIYDIRDYISGAKGTVGAEPRLRKSFIKRFKK